MRPQFYSLRQSRYDALTQDISDWASSIPACRKLRVLIVGCGAGTELRHLEVKPHFDKLIVSGANIDDQFIYNRESYDELYRARRFGCSAMDPRKSRCGAERGACA